MQNDVVSGFYIINEGKVEILFHQDNEDDIFIKTASLGDIVGHRGMVGDDHYPVSGRVLEKTSLTFIPKKSFDKILSSQPKISQLLLTFFADDLRRSEKMIIDQLNLKLSESVAYSKKIAEELCQEKELALKSMKFKGEFLANMSHEIRTPLNGIIGMIDIISNTTELSETQTEYINIVKKSSKDLLVILTDILDLSKLEAGQMKIEFKEVEIRNVVDKVVSLFSAKAKESNLEIQCFCDDNVPLYLMSSDIRLTQIISNLLGNAMKFTNKGGVSIRISLLKKKKNKSIIKIEVIDSGQGISYEDQKKLFVQFQQLDQSSKQKMKGTGLGLAICKSLVSLLGGEIGVTSKIDVGSNFWFTFEAYDTDKGGENMLKEEAVEEKVNFNLNVLLVDDIELHLFVGKLMLSNLGCSVDTATNGYAAVEKSKQKDYDLILMDIEMPEMDGVEATQQIRFNHLDPTLIIGLSANQDKDDIERFISLGMDDYLPKPIDSNILKDKLNEWFSFFGVSTN